MFKHTVLYGAVNIGDVLTIISTPLIRDHATSGHSCAISFFVSSLTGPCIYALFSLLGSTPTSTLQLFKFLKMSADKYILCELDYWYSIFQTHAQPGTDIIVLSAV